MVEEIRKILEDHERRIKELENADISKYRLKPKPVKTDYSGLAGGIRFLINKRFLSEPRTANEIMEELKREGYHYSIASVSKMLSVNFTKNMKTLSRVKEDNFWKYVVRR